MTASILRRIVAERRAIVVPLMVALAANILAFVLIVRPLETKFAGAADRAAAAANARRAAERELTIAKNLVSGKTDADRELGAFYEKVLPADISAARRMTYASVPALADKSDVHYEARTTIIDDKETDARFGHMSIRMVLQGDYANLRQFIYALERAPEFVIIDDVALAERQAGEGITLTLTLSTYYRLASGS